MATMAKAPVRTQRTGKASGPISRDGQKIGTVTAQPGKAVPGHAGRVRSGEFGGKNVGVSGSGNGGTTAPSGKRVAKRG